MRTCVSCRDPIPETKRRDAKYCDKAACRGREYRKRQAEASASHATHAASAASTVLACPCGRQYRLHITEIHAHEPSIGSAPSPSLATPEALTQAVLLTDQNPGELSPQEPILAATSEALTKTVLHTDPQPAELTSSASAPALDSEALTQTVLRTDPQHAEPLPAAIAAALDSETLTRTDRTDPPSLVTLEMYFTDGMQRRIPFGKALRHEGNGRWVLRPNVHFAFSSGEEDQRSLGGRPGAWPAFYGSLSPTAHDYDRDLVVMNWDHQTRRGRVVSIKVLRSLLGEGWRQKLREMRDGQ